MNYSIGEFSQIAMVTVKALRLYHEKGLLVPGFVDRESGYRYYDAEQVEDACIIQTLKEMGFSLAEIKEVFTDCDEDVDLVDRLREKKLGMENRIVAFKKSIQEIEVLVAASRMNAEVGDMDSGVEEKNLPDMLIAGHRIVGKYSDAGKGFRILGRRAGRYAKGRSMCLMFDGEYREEGANFEPCLEVKQHVEHEDIDCRILEGGVALTIVHKGPYERLSESYRKLFEVVKREGAKLKCPSREVYHKGPGMILRGSPAKYLTEIQLLVEA